MRGVVPSFCPMTPSSSPPEDGRQQQSGPCFPSWGGAGRRRLAFARAGYDGREFVAAASHTYHLAELFAYLSRVLARNLGEIAEDYSLFSQGLLNVIQFRQLPIDRAHLCTMRLEAVARKRWFDTEK